MKLKPIDEQVVVVFGASSGIGRGTALRLAEEGARVVVAARDSEGLQSLISEIRNRGGEAIPVVADAAVFHQVKAVADRAVEEFGRLDTWVHSAAVTLYAPFEETTPEEFARVIDVNLIGAAHGAMAALPHIRHEGRGALIFLSSVEGERALPLQSAYAASKHGLIGFVDALRLELMQEGVPISVTTVMPATIDTPLYDKARSKLGVKPRGYPPVYDPKVAVDAVVYAAAHPIRDIVAGGGARMLTGMHMMSRSMTDRFLAATGSELQRTDQPKAKDEPGNLFEPIAGHATVSGGFGAEARPSSAYTWMEMHPSARRAIYWGVGGGLALGVAGALGGLRFLRGGKGLARRAALIAIPVGRASTLLSGRIRRARKAMRAPAAKVAGMAARPVERVSDLVEEPAAYLVSLVQRRRRPRRGGWSGLVDQLLALWRRAPIVGKRHEEPHGPVDQAKQYVVEWVGALQRR